jgi:uncharacterized protein YggE
MEWTRRKLFVTPLAIASLLAIAGSNLAGAQEGTPVSGAIGRIEVTGTGESEAEASGAIVQLILRAPFQMSNAPMEVTKDGLINQPTVTAEQMAAVVTALVDEGIAENKIGSFLSESPYPGMFGFGTAVVAFEVDRDGFLELLTVVDTAVAAGEATGVQFDPIGIAYIIDNCELVKEEALADAVTDARAQAESLARVLGVTLGSLQKASTLLAGGGYYAGGGPIPGTCDEPPTLETGLTSYLFSLDPARIGTMEIYTQVVLSYTIAE